MVIRWRRIFLLLFKLIVIIAFFDGIRNNLLYNNYLSFVKEALVLSLFTLVVLKNKLRFKVDYFTLPLFIFYIYHFLLGIISMGGFLSNFSGAMVFYKFLQLPFLIYSFSNFESVTGERKELLFKFIVKVSVVFVILNTSLYFYELPIWVKFRPQWGRFGCGYPTMDVVSLSYSLILLVFSKELLINNTKRLAYTVIIVSGIVLQVTGTGFALLGAIFLTFLFFSFFSKKKNNYLIRNAIYTTSILLIIAFFSIQFVKDRYPDLYSNALVIGERKVGQIFGKQDVSLEIRDDQFADAKLFQDKWYKEFFGIGFGRMSMDLGKDYKKTRFFHIEDQFSTNIIVYGYFGSFLFVLLLLSYVINGWFIKSQANLKYIYMLSGVIFAFNSHTLVSLYLISNTALFALYYGFMLIEREKKHDLLRINSRTK